MPRRCQALCAPRPAAARHNASLSAAAAGRRGGAGGGTRGLRTAPDERSSTEAPGGVFVSQWTPVIDGGHAWARPVPPFPPPPLPLSAPGGRGSPQDNQQRQRAPGSKTVAAREYRGRGEGRRRELPGSCQGGQHGPGPPSACGGVASRFAAAPLPSGPCGPAGKGRGIAAPRPGRDRGVAGVAR